MYYEPFAQYATAVHGLTARVHKHLPISGIQAELAAGQLIIASVHKEIRRPGLPPPGRGGHLVLVTGSDGDLLHFRNPSGHTHRARNAVLPGATFAAFYAERAISVTVRSGERVAAKHQDRQHHASSGAGRQATPTRL